MKVVGVCSHSIGTALPAEITTSSIGDVNVPLAVIEVDQPDLKRASLGHRKVLVRVNAFSCNYRDKGIIVKHALKRSTGLRSGVTPFGFFGSDFVGTVVAKGPGVTAFEVGARVIPDCSFPVSRDGSAAPGVVTNEASKGWLVLDEAKLMEIPDVMTDEVAAGFSIGGQTAHSMVRRTVESSDERVLVTSGRSNTSQFVSWIMRHRAYPCDLISTSPWSQDELEFVAPCSVKAAPLGASWATNLTPGSYDVIIDPFFDLHIDASVDLLKDGGRYITCGFKNQHPTFSEPTDAALHHDLHAVMVKAMIKNARLMGNCIGYSEDLAAALELYSNTRDMPMPIDSTYRSEDGARFLERTYNDRGRLGKALMIYDH